MRAVTVSLALLITMSFSVCAAAQQHGKSKSEKQEKADWPIVWLHKPGDCQNTRTRVLVRDRANLIKWADPMSCTIASGLWNSWGRPVQVGVGQAMVVPLVTPGNAVKHGAANWTRKQQIAFINDMENLIILDPVSVHERGNYSPARWIPIKRYRCEYGRRWRDVKKRYHLTMGKDEKAAVAKLISMCPDKAGSGKKE